MTLKQLLDKASSAFDCDGIMAQMYDKNGVECPDAGKQGDTLGLFLVRELADTFDPDACDLEQLAIARRAVDMANEQLNDVHMALDPEEQP